ncbi:MAG: FAD-dependent oxidoreductase [Chloroflexaceae bacterium]|nr:FAD-dependent oxidoreductase [Chloroflexaceae bacterium]
MASKKPVILTVDDDLSVLNAVVRDLRRRYAEQYRIVRADSGAAALAALRELKQRNEVVALFLADQRMPQMSGTEFLAQAILLYPDARRVLLTAYADTDAAIQAINQVAVNYYLLKPWDPPEEKLYPVLDDLLDDWLADYRPPFEGIRVIAHRWSAQAHQIKDFLARNQVPYLYLDVERDSQARELLAQLHLNPEQLPYVILDDGTVLPAPSITDVANRVGLQTRAAHNYYELAIVGGGPAGLAAAVYGASEGLRTVLIEREAPGGQAGTSSRIENYLGFPSGLSGSELARRAVAQARRFGVDILAPQEVCSMRIEGQYRILQLADGQEIACHALIVAVGLSYRKLEVPGIEALTGAGVYYGASLTEAVSCQDNPVFIIGAGNSAGQAAIYLAQYAAHVTLIVRGDDLGKSMSHYLIERIEQSPQISVRLESEVIGVQGTDHLEAITLHHRRTTATETLPASGLFIFIGAMPHTEWLPPQVVRDERGFVQTGTHLLHEGKPPKGWTGEHHPSLLESSVPGVFVVGDVRSGSIKRVASAVGEGSIAVQFVHQYLSKVR